MTQYNIKEATVEGEFCYCVYYNGLLYKELAYFKDEFYAKVLLKALEIKDMRYE